MRPVAVALGNESPPYCPKMCNLNMSVFMVYFYLLWTTKPTSKASWQFRLYDSLFLVLFCLYVCCCCCFVLFCFLGYQFVLFMGTLFEFVSAWTRVEVTQRCHGALECLRLSISSHMCQGQTSDKWPMAIVQGKYGYITNLRCLLLLLFEF